MIIADWPDSLSQYYHRLDEIEMAMALEDMPSPSKKAKKGKGRVKTEKLDPVKLEASSPKADIWAKNKFNPTRASFVPAQRVKNTKIIELDLFEAMAVDDDTPRTFEVSPIPS